jgi:enamine deaminase RidA (YjgF/YER057c/UK114 family)
MEYHIIDTGQVPATVHVSRFAGDAGGDEFQLSIRPAAPGSSETQLDWVERAYRQALEQLGLPGSTARLRRFFCRDLPSQTAVLAARPFANPRQPDEPGAVSWIGQAPLSPARLALWAWHIRGPATLPGHHWTTGLASPGRGTTGQQTRRIFEHYNAWLHARGLTLANHVIRTWLFVPNVDANYEQMVAARREFFAEHGLTADGHYIASTGVEGQPADPAARVVMDAYAIAGIRPEQIRYLTAPHQLSPTQLYGVTFERATAVAWRDRTQVFISGTASIDAAGQILHPGNVTRQLDRALENIAALLDQAGATLADMGVIIVYIRDPADHALVWQAMRRRFGRAPIEVVVAPVCRPGWLVEVEGQATLRADHPTLPAL